MPYVLLWAYYFFALMESLYVFVWGICFPIFAVTSALSAFGLFISNHLDRQLAWDERYPIPGAWGLSLFGGGVLFLLFSGIWDGLIASTSSAHPLVLVTLECGIVFAAGLLTLHALANFLVCVLVLTRFVLLLLVPLIEAVEEQ